ncbi:MAG: hypothetical protein HQK96_20340, partial [Nitrospirae bacterium]|nr:hypothetical protein [Nitrospirota bacterium]
MLVIQGSENKNANMATLPNKFTYYECWDVKDDGSDCRYGATVQLFDGEWSCLLGSNRAGNPIEGMAYCFSARTNYLTTADNQTATINITAKAGDPVTLHENIKAITVKKWDGSKGYTVDSDYTIDLSQGIFMVKSGGSIFDGDSIRIDYSYLTMTCYYKIHQILLFPAGLFYDDTMQPTNRTPSRYEIQYKTNPAGALIGNALIGLEYETANPNPEEDGYETFTLNPVVAISSTEALVISKKRQQVISPFSPRTYSYAADFASVDTEWGVCFDKDQCFIGGHNHYGVGRVITYIFHSTGTVTLTKEQIVWTEELTIGSEVIFTAVKTIKTESNFNNGDGISINTEGMLVSASQSWACESECFTWDTTCPSGFSGGVTSDCEAINRAFPTTSGTCGDWHHPSVVGGAIVVPGSASHSSIIGTGDIHVKGMANADGKNNRIIIYQYTEYAIYHYI